jgi:hypothetical protein
MGMLPNANLAEHDRYSLCLGCQEPQAGNEVLVRPSNVVLRMMDFGIILKRFQMGDDLPIFRGWGRVLIQLSRSRRVDPILPS